jgi:hypothetical protein
MRRAATLMHRTDALHPARVNAKGAVLRPIHSSWGLSRPPTRLTSIMPNWRCQKRTAPTHQPLEAEDTDLVLQAWYHMWEKKQRAWWRWWLTWGYQPAPFPYEGYRQQYRKLNFTEKIQLKKEAQATPKTRKRPDHLARYPRHRVHRGF